MVDTTSSSTDQQRHIQDYEILHSSDTRLSERVINIFETNNPPEEKLFTTFQTAAHQYIAPDAKVIFEGDGFVVCLKEDLDFDGAEIMKNNHICETIAYVIDNIHQAHRNFAIHKYIKAREPVPAWTNPVVVFTE